MRRLSAAELSRNGKRKETLCEEDCEAIATLMGSGFSLQDALTVLKDDTNARCMDRMKERMEKGDVFADVFREVCPSLIRGYFEGFSRFLPFLDSLSISLDTAKKEKAQKDALYKGLVYPLALLVSVMAGMRLFSATVLPAMLDVMREFETDTGMYEVLIRGIEILHAMILAGGILLGAAAAYFLNRKHIGAFYSRLSARFPDSVMSGIASRQFSLFFLECVRHRIPTRRTLQILKNLEEKPLTALIAKELDETLLAGGDIEHAVLHSGMETKLKRFFRIAVYSSESEKMLEGYLKMSSVRSEKRIRRFTRTVQLVCYGLIAAVLVLIYQILLMPVNVLQTI